MLKYGSIATLFLTPLVFFSARAYPYITSKTFFFYGITEILFFIWLYALSVDVSLRLSRKQWIAFSPFALYIIWMTIAGFFALNPHLAFWSSLSRGTGLLTLYHVFCFSLVIASLIKKYGKEYLLRMYYWLISGGTLITVSTWLGDSGFNVLSGSLQKSGGGGLFGNSSFTATYLLFILAISFLFLIKGEISRIKKTYVISSVLIIIFSPLFINLYGIFSNRSILGDARGALLGLIVGTSTSFIVWLMCSSKKLIKGLGITLSIFGVISSVYLWTLLIQPGALIHSKFVESASGTRFVFWDVAQSAINEHPFLGYGPENYPLAFQRHFDPKMVLSEYKNEVWNDRAHNIMYDTGVSSGYPGIILYLVFISGALYLVYSSFKSNLLSKGEISIFAGLIIGYLFQNLFVFDSLISYVLIGVILAILIGIQISRNEKNIQTKLIKESFNQKIFLGSFLLIAGFSSWYYFTWSPSQKAKLYGTVFKLPINKRADQYSTLLSGSHIGEDWDVGGFADGVDKIYINNKEKIISNESVREYSEKDILSLISHLEDVRTRNQYDYRLHVKIVQLYLTYIDITNDEISKEKVNEILALVNYTQTLSPGNPQIYWLMAEIKILNKDYVGAIESYNDAIKIDPTNKDSQELLSTFLNKLDRMNITIKN